MENRNVVKKLLDMSRAVSGVFSMIIDSDKKVGETLLLPGLMENPQDFGIRLEVCQGGSKNALVIPPSRVKRSLPPCTLEI